MNKLITVRRNLKSRRLSTKRALRFLGVPHATRIDQAHPAYKRQLVAARYAHDEDLAKTLTWVWAHLKKNMFRSCPTCKEAIKAGSQRCSAHDVKRPALPRLPRPRPRSTRLFFVNVVRAVVNGTPLKSLQVQAVIRKTFPEVTFDDRKVNGALAHLRRRREITVTGAPRSYMFTKSMVCLILLPILIAGCSVSRLRTPDFKDDPRFEDSTANIMPRRLPDAPQPKLATVLPTTTSVRLSWERVPWARAYRVDYGTDFLTNSLMTQATNCTIHGLELVRVYHYNVRACDGRNYGPVLNLVIK